MNQQRTRRNAQKAACVVIANPSAIARPRVYRDDGRAGGIRSPAVINSWMCGMWPKRYGQEREIAAMNAARRSCTVLNERMIPSPPSTREAKGAVKRDGGLRSAHWQGEQAGAEVVRLRQGPAMRVENIGVEHVKGIDDERPGHQATFQIANWPSALSVRPGCRGGRPGRQAGGQHLKPSAVRREVAGGTVESVSQSSQSL
jgi:hypothetical protein